MDETASEIIDRETALANFDHARDDWEDAFSKAPDDALGYKPEGDDYTIGFLLPHITSSMRNYSTVVDKIHEAAFGEVRFESYPPGPSDSTTLDRAAALTDMEDAHDTLASQLRELAYEDFNRKAPVYYPGSNEPYPTSAADIIGWVTDHYQEHIPHVAELLESWRRKKS
jgi:hypothetical protein